MSVEKWWNETCGRGKREKPREKPTQTPFRPPRNPHGGTVTQTRDPSGGRRASNRLRHEAAYESAWTSRNSKKWVTYIDWVSEGQTVNQVDYKNVLKILHAVRYEEDQTCGRMPHGSFIRTTRYHWNVIWRKKNIQLMKHHRATSFSSRKWSLCSRTRFEFVDAVQAKTIELRHHRQSSAHSPTFSSLHLRYNSFSNPSAALPTSQLILQIFRCFTYVTARSPTLLLLILRYRLYAQEVSSIAKRAYCHLYMVQMTYH